MSTTSEWQYITDLPRNQLEHLCNEKIHTIFKDFPIIEMMLRQGVYGAPFVDELHDLEYELRLLQKIFDKLKGVSNEPNK